MDAVFAILVLGAVIFFGALISAGNERQRKAIDGIREQTALWAMQDLRLKREKLAREVKVDDPVAWLNQVVAKVYGENLGLTMTEVFNNPQALICTAKDGRRVVFSPLTMREIKRLSEKHKSRFSKIGNVHPLLKLSKRSQFLELSLLNSGVFFDLELSIAWKMISGSDFVPITCIWLYWL